MNRMDQAYGLGFAASSTAYPFLGQGAFGHGGAGGSQAFADPRSRLAYGCSRRRFAFGGSATPEGHRLVRAVHRAATAG
ncbi:hypothetical protein [Streptomyces sp. NPDC048650]|uniref:hypothetical protein n=1 Tax=Streptomyces sp. NPDC048650 TaxID=3365583 RepID=UPI0037150F73